MILLIIILLEELVVKEKEENKFDLFKNRIKKYKNLGEKLGLIKNISIYFRYR